MLKRLAISLSLLVILAPIGLYLSWSQWSPSMARLLLRGYDIDLHQAKISRPSLTGIAISDLVADYRLSGYQLQLQANDLTLTYRPLQLLKGRLATVHIDQLQLAVAADASREAIPQGSGTSLALLLPQTWLAALPLQQLQIDRLLLESADLLPQYSLSGDLRLSPEQLQLQFEIQNRQPQPSQLQALPSQPSPLQLLPSQPSPSPQLPSQLLPSQPLPPDAPTYGHILLSADRHNALAAAVTLEGEAALQLSSRIASAPDSQAWEGTLELKLGSASALAQQLGLLLPNQQLDGQLEIGWTMPLPEVIHSDTLPQLQLSGHLRSGGQYRTPHPDLSASATAPQGDAALLAGNFQLDARYQADSRQLQLVLEQTRVTAGVDLALPFIPPRPGVDKQPLQLELELQPGARLQALMAARKLELTNLAGEVRAAQQHSGIAAQLDFAEATGTIPWVAPEHASGAAAIALQGDLDKLVSEAVSAQKIQLNSRGRVTLEAHQLSYTTVADTVLKAHSLRGDSWQAPQLQITANTPLTLLWQADDLKIPAAQFRLGRQQLQLAGEPLQFGGANLDLHNLHLPSGAAASAELTLGIRALVLQHQQRQLAALTINSQLGLDQNRLAGSFNVHTDNKLLSSNGQLQHDLGTGKGQLSADTRSAKLGEKQVFLPALVKPLGLPLDISGGQLSATTRLSWNRQGLTQSSAEVQLQNLSGFYQRNLVRGLNAKLLARNLHDQWHISADSLTIANIDVGIPIRNIQLGFSSEAQTVLVKDLQAELLGGRASQKALLYNWSAPENHLVIDLHNIQLNQVLKLESGISGSGRLSGSLPLTLSSTGLRVDKGRLSSLAPGGVIKYDSKVPLGKSALDASLQLTLDALKNFHYQVLDVQVDADEAGDLVLRARLQGNNPDLKQQRPIHFNLNITENIPALLKSLKLTQDISQDLNQRIESLYQPRHQGARQ
ncbi:hypothetical protein G8764_11885 [Pseudomaricurvus alcaniphilus]|uniref:intermembrane phospholipid transport protein YdbH family protein n=1 Tax=Pseudomaricurvus alcaniphilus TaxID=1166482 RepID=UPI001409777B|nr:hypothetical protein [Pseudomaricurvus alcaniphilus]